MNHMPRISCKYEILDTEKKKLFNSQIIRPNEIPKGEVNLKLYTKEGILKKEIKKDFDSFVYNFPLILEYMMKLSAGNTITLLNGSTDTGFKQLDITDSATNTSSSTYGVFIGDMREESSTGITSTIESGIAESLQYNDYNLRRKLSDADIGTNTSTITMPDSSTLKLTRRFTNNEATALTLKISEVGLIGLATDGLVTKKILFARDGFNDGTNNYVSVAQTEFIDITYKFTVTDSSGYTNNWLRMLSSIFNGSAVVDNMINTAGTGVASNFNTTSPDAKETSTGALYGILIGGKNNEIPTASLTLNKSAYNLDNKLTNSDIGYGATTSIPTAYADGKSSFGAYRDFTNNSSSANIYINEAGLFILGSTGNYFMLTRVLLTGSANDYIVVEPGKTLRVYQYFEFPLGNIAIVDKTPTAV